MFIETNPREKIYRDLIDLAFEVCNEFVLVVRINMDINTNINYVLEKLQPSLKEVKEQFEWPGTIYGGEQPALVYYYNTDNHAKEILKQVSNSLHDWVQPNLPEDLSFIKNHKPWLINTSHEYESYFETKDEEEISKIIKIKGLKVRL
ncbi:stage III sporulation protein AH [Clostridium sp. FP1]|uniref:stage III sporulation protein AH n=1 Tax=Clostridium sp. FP1 TaxID=2724076 RepID=UPI001CCDE5C0|nr:stage III sporulation protein AH [Clostridium sp. FP1]MBZ9637768.1 stage III sporulation protein AH [Clostridium sp. FP1]